MLRAAVEPRGLALASAFLRGPSSVSIHAALAAAAACTAAGARGARTTACVAYCAGANPTSLKARRPPLFPAQHLLRSCRLAPQAYEVELPSVAEVFGPRALFMSAMRRCVARSLAPHCAAT